MRNNPITTRRLTPIFRYGPEGEPLTRMERFCANNWLFWPVLGALFGLGVSLMVMAIR